MDLNIIVNIILAVIAIMALIFGISQYKRKKPVWAYSTRHIIGRDAEAPLELKYVFGTREVTEVYKTTLIFFNMGKDKFCGDLLPGGDSDINEAIVIQFKGAEILRPPTIANRSKGAVNFTVEQVNNCADSIQLHIPILNHNDGATIEVWHTKYNEIDIPNADIPLLKEFIRKRPEGFWGNLAVISFIILGGITLAGFGIARSEYWSDFLPPLLFVIMLLVMSVFGIPHLLRYRTFPSWSRPNEKTQKEQ